MRMLDVSRQRVNQLADEDDFPQPEADLEMGRVWSREDIEDWAKAKGRRLNPEPPGEATAGTD